jgi:hypothetical protein
MSNEVLPEEIIQAQAQNLRVAADPEPPANPPVSIQFESGTIGSFEEDDENGNGTHDLFADQADIKKKVRASILEEKPMEYNVTDYYHENGFYQWLARHQLFENITLGVIAFNAVWMGIDTDWNDAMDLLDAHPVFQTVEQMFCIFFSFELYIRFMAFEIKFGGVRQISFNEKFAIHVPAWMLDKWFMFDSLLVVMMIFETWVFTMITVVGGGEGGSPLPIDTSILRLFRLLRLSRLMRMLRSLPELMILIKGMVKGMVTCGYVMALLIIALYVFGIAITQMAVDTPSGDALFHSVEETMYRLMVHATFLDNLAEFCDNVKADSYLVLVLVLIFIGLSALCILNMLIGVLCDVIQSVATCEREEMRQEKVKELMKDVVRDLDEDMNGMVSQKEFKGLINKPIVLRVLDEVGVDPYTLLEFADMMFVKDGEFQELEFDDFSTMVLELRQSNGATVKDVMTLWRQMSPKIAGLQNQLTKLDTKLEHVEKDFEAVNGLNKSIQEKVAAINRELFK